MKVLFINHHFRHDIDALVSESRKMHIIKEISPEYFHERSKEVLPPSIFFKSGLETEYTQSDFDKYRKKWIKILRKSIYEIYRIFPFDVLISPHYVFFYIYDLPEILSEMGIPFIIVQKETTRPPFFINEEAKVVNEHYPFKADVMTVCGHDQVKFSMACGVPKDKLIVTGQPRFDFYKKPELWKSKNEIGIPENGNKNILFFTYYLDCAVTPTASFYKKDLWKEIRSETEEILIDTAKNCDFNLLIKPHPQHDPKDLKKMERYIKDLCGKKWGTEVFMLKGNDDARNLIVNSDIVVGFQTTALLESIAAGKNVIYTFWSDTVVNLKDEILPYHTYEPLLSVARSKEELKSYIANGLKEDKSTDAEGTRIRAFTERLGPLDGKASQRVWEVIENEFSKIQKTEIRRKGITNIEKNKKCSLLYEFCLAISILMIANALYYFIKIFLYLPTIQKREEGIRKRIERSRERARECIETLKYGEVIRSVIVGRYNENWYYRVKSILYSVKHR